MVREGRRRGYSLLELLVVMAILGLLLGLGGSWGNLMNRERRYQAALDLRRSLNFARAQAVVLESRVTLCALDENRDCRGDWSGRDYAVFLDENRNRHADESEILRMGHWSEKRGTLTWRAAFGRGYITFEPGGGWPAASPGTPALLRSFHAPEPLRLGCHAHLPGWTSTIMK